MTTQSAAPGKRGGQVPLKEKISFAFAEFGSQFIWTTAGSYLLTFYTDVALIPAVAAGNILLLARVLDGIQDLAFGYIAERTKSINALIENQAMNMKEITASVEEAKAMSDNIEELSKNL